jgi:transketolase
MTFLIENLRKKADWVWAQTLRIHQSAPEIRVASSLSPIEILVALYYGGLMNFRPKNPFWNGRDRCIISKGHGSLCMYPILADLGFFPKKELTRVCENGSFLGGIPDPIIPGYETINGSLGHGAGVGSGVALALKKQGKPQNVFILTGDGELHEGSNWEAFMFAAQHELDNLIILVDNNQISMLGPTDKIVSHLNLQEKMISFGWDCRTVSNGHSHIETYNAIKKTIKIKQKKPKMIIFNTKKGNRVPGLENAPLSHVTAIKSDLIDTLIKR